MNLQQAMKRIADLEERVRQLEARPEQHIHYHMAPYVAPVFPQQWPEAPAYDPWRWVPPMPVTCGQIGGGSSN